MKAFVFVSDVVVAITLFALALELLPLAPAYQFYGKPAGLFASDALMMVQQGATSQQLGWVFTSNSMCGTISYYSPSGALARDLPMDCQCSQASAKSGLYSLAGKTPDGFAKVTVCRK